MFGFLTLDGSGAEQDPLTNDAAAENFARSLPLDDPLRTLGALSGALTTLLRKSDPSLDQLAVLLTLDRRTERLCEQLLVNSVERGARSRPPESAIWDSLLELSNAFGRAYEHFLRHVRERSSNRGWADMAPSVLLRLFLHRKAQGLLLMFRYEQPNPGWWRDLNEAYRFAQARGLATGPAQAGDESSCGTLESQFLQILLLQLMNNGQFIPREALWARQWLATWSEVVALRPEAKHPGASRRDEGFVVNLDGAEGLRRSPVEPAEALYFVDTTLMLELIDQQITALRGPSAGASGSGAALRPVQLGLLAKLKLIYSPKSVRVERRGERRVVALMTAQVVASLPCVIRTLHEEWQNAAAATRLAVPFAEETTITDVGGSWRTPGLLVESGLQTDRPLAAALAGAASPNWRVKDRSDSGTLLRGRADDLMCMIPGSVIMLRDSDDAQWTVAVIRRLRKLVRNNVEIGVEHVGRAPQGVTIAASRDRASGASAAESQERFAALFLRESARFPKLRIKTLLLPAREFKPSRVMTLLSTTTHYTLRLKQPLEVQAEFVWTTFEVVSKHSVGSLAAPSR